MTTELDSLVAGVLERERRSLAKAITLVESNRPEDRGPAVDLIERLLPRTGGAVRLAVSGPPGAGKSTFIEALGMHLIESGRRVAVLAVDPSSTTSKGSVLGDKTRMERLATHPDAFIRPSPSQGTLGGVARRTREAGLVLDAAGFDVVLLETVGVGQSETAAADMVDCFLLLLPPGGGDELQGIKRGIMELADVIVITKADGDLTGAARRAEADYRHAIHLLRPKHRGWTVPVVAVSAAMGTGLADAWTAVEEHEAHLRSTDRWDAVRSKQLVSWMWEEIDSGLRDALTTAGGASALAEELEAEVRDRQLSPGTAAAQVLDAFQAARADQ